MSYEFHAKNVSETLSKLNTNATSGLTVTEAQKRLAENGLNRLASAKKKSLILRILAQFKDFLVLILLAAAVISVIVGDGLKDAILIVGILIVNVIISITQENRADNALAELKNMSSPKAKVKRSGHVEKIDSVQVVVGDIVILDAGDYVPADVRIIESINLKIDEAALTGESLPVSKYADRVLDASASLGDRVNLASMGTVVTYGRGVGVVYATGMQTEMGKIATILNETEETATPLQDKLNAMAKTLGIVCIVACAIIFGVGFFYGMDLMEMLMVSVSLAVAAVPEGIAIVATVILAIGVQKMVKRNVIVKRLRAVETLGSTTVICSDKTGTLTQNKMTVVKVFDTENVYDVTGDIAGTYSKNIPLMAEIGVLCNDAIYEDERDFAQASPCKTPRVIGDPTEAAILAFGAKLSLKKDPLNESYHRIQEIPFDSDRKLMSTFNEKGDIIVMNTKGAPDVIIKRSSHVYMDGQVVPMTEPLRARLIAQNEAFAAQALRVLGFAYKEYDNKFDNLEEGLTYVGMMCMIDPPREGVRESVAKCHAAGINVKMITGDHKITAAAIATTLGIMQPGEEALDGSDLEDLFDAQLAEKVKTVNVFARVSPEHKVRIVSAIKQSGNIVAMTGDGVNDAPSLKKADIGIAMGITGTDVSKEAADMILTDDNFVSITGAVEQGRIIYSNIRKVAGYLLSTNIGEILIIFIAILAGLPVPLVATQLLFVNLLTDAFPAFALGMEKKEPGVMTRPPRDPNEAIINKSMRTAVALRAVILAVGTLGAFLYGLFMHDYAVAISMCFFTLVASELIVSYSAKSEGINLRGLLSNRFLNISIVFSLLILFAVIYVPFLADLFSAVPLTGMQLLISAGFVLFVVLGSELSKISRPA